MDPSTPAGLDLAQALVGLPVAVVIVLLALATWRLNSTGALVTGREHRTIVEQLELRIATEADRADTSAAESRYWQGITLRALNVSEAALGRREGG